jgi:RimJ/RimL family protein N-acetyltransferase
MTLEDKETPRKPRSIVSDGSQASSHDIATSRLRLLAMSEPFLEACLRPDKREAEARIGLRLSRSWLDETDLIEMRLAEFRDDPAYSSWGLRAIGLAGRRVMIGHIGFHSLPNPDYLQPYWPDGVELAYTIYPRYRRCGYGYEATTGMLRWAAHTAHVGRFLLSIAAENAASRALAEKLGFVKAIEYHDEQLNLEYVYVLDGKAMAKRVGAYSGESSAPNL